MYSLLSTYWPNHAGKKKHGHCSAAGIWKLAVGKTDPASVKVASDVDSDEIRRAVRTGTIISL